MKIEDVGLIVLREKKEKIRKAKKKKKKKSKSFASRHWVFLTSKATLSLFRFLLSFFSMKDWLFLTRKKKKRKGKKKNREMMIIM